MIISRAPLRLPLGGGATDMPYYYKRYGGFLISGGINKHVYVGVNRYFFDQYSLKYSKIEITDKLNEIQHNLIREALRLVNITPNIEITSLADIPSGTGLGSSGAFLVALLNSLHEFKGYHEPRRRLAEEACKIEIDILKEAEGKQDKYACAFGGIKAYEFGRDDSVKVIPLANEDMIISELQQKLFLFFTGKKRTGKASDVLKKHVKSMKEGEEIMFTSLNQIKQIGLDTRQAFENNDFDKFGYLLNKHWEIKKQYSPSSTSEFIDKCYKKAIEMGALGGKIMGAGGGGGFFMFYHPGEPKEVWNFLEVMKGLGLRKMDYQFDTDGVIVINKEEQ